MINAKNLLTDLKQLIKKLEPDIRERCDAVPEINRKLQAEHGEAQKEGRTAQTFSAWRDEIITQAASSWILACVFVRFMEDTDMIGDPFISGPCERLDYARDARTLYFQSHPLESDREYLLHVFQTVSELPGVSALFDKKHNRLWHVQPTGDGAGLLIGFFQRIDDKAGGLVHDFTDPDWDTRFLGDLYQDLSEDIRKKYALLQTPDFVEEFILDRTLNPAIDTFGLKDFRMIDPACGSGHFVISGFHRILDLWRRMEPEAGVRDLVQRALNAVHGVDINPQASAIARFRLLAAALKASMIQRLKDAPAFEIHVATGDSLLHGPRPGGAGAQQMTAVGEEPLAYVYETEDADKLRRYLGRQYHAVVGNPPYITVKDKALSKAYRARFGSCHRQFSLVCPFLERFFDLAVSGGRNQSAGYVGAIVANSFMKREFGKKLIEEYIPKWDLTHVVDTSGAYIPGHGTPTVILFGRNQRPVSETIRAVMGIKGEPGTPEKASEGKVWKAIIEQIDHPGSESEYASVDNNERISFYQHPWSLGGGGVTVLLEMIRDYTENTLHEIFSEIGRTTVVGEDDIWIFDEYTPKRLKFSAFITHLGIGECFRDWYFKHLPLVIYPYHEIGGNLIQIKATALNPYFFYYRIVLKNRTIFGKKIEDHYKNWWVHLEHYTPKLQTPYSISFAFVATHNHFVLDRGGKVFNRSAPVIKLPKEATIEDHLELIGLLNSSTALFWGRQTFFPKGGFASGKWEERLEWDGTKLRQFPIPEKKPIELATELDALGAKMTEYLPASVIKTHPPSEEAFDEAAEGFTAVRERMIALQEELDWQCYNFYKITDEELWASDMSWVPRVRLGERAFEIVMARKMKAGKLETAWFDRHGSTPAAEIPDHWPEDYRRLVELRIRAIESDKHIGLIEQPEYKRRWAMEPWDKQVKTAIEQWLLNRLEKGLSGRDLAAETEPAPATEEPRLISCARLADRLRDDGAFLRAGELYTGRAGFDLIKLVESLAAGESVPYLPSLRYKESGLRKRRDWEHTWDLQRKEDAVDARTELPESDPGYLTQEAAERLKQDTIGEIPVPPKYQSKDFAKPSYWKLRGKLDVPKERFISYPGLELEAGGSPVIAWAGWDHLEQARALAEYLEEAKASGWPVNRLIPILAGLAELLPWLKQWHNRVDADYGVGMGDFFATYVESEAGALGSSIESLTSGRC